MAAPTQSEWIPKFEAAQLLGISTRQVERYAHAGRIRMQLARLPGERTDRNIYAMEDVVRLKAQREEPTPKLLAFSDAVARVENPAIAALTALIGRTAPPPVSKAWLTLAEASQYSGLGEPEIARLIRASHVYAAGRGKRTWRIQRDSLDAWGRKDHLA